MSGQPISSLKTYWFFDNMKTTVQFNKHLIIVTGNTVSCSVCKTNLPISVIKTESFKEELALLFHHITDKKHLQNVLNCIVNRVSPSVRDIDSQFKIFKKNVLYCLLCDTPVLSIVSIEQAFKGLKIHVCGKYHRQELNMRMLSNIQQKNVTTTAVEYTQNQSKASASATVSVPSILCPVCESQIEVFNHDISLSQDLHKQSEQHSSACKRKLRKMFAKYEKGNHINLLEELFQIYPELFSQLEHCELFRDIVYYFLCSVCEKPISNSVPSVNDEIYKHLCSSKECKSKYLRKIFGEFLSDQNDTIETRVAEKKDTNNLYSDTISELFESLPPHLKSNECVISTVGNSLYCTVCSCNINTCANKSKTLRNLKLHLETIHFENLLNKVFAQLPKTLQISKQFMYYKDNFIMCRLCNITGLTYSPVKFKETATNVKGHLKSKRHLNGLEKWFVTTKSNKPPSVYTNPLTETTETFKGHIDNLIGHLLPHKPELATLVKNNSKFLRIHCMDFMCILCEKKIGDVQKIEDACNTIVAHFQSKMHIALMNNTSENVSLWKLVYDCYAPELIRSNERHIQKVGDKFRCALCSFDISEQKVENEIEQILKHVSSEQHNITNVFANWSHSPKWNQ